MCLQDLEATRPRAILDIIQAASEFRFAQDNTGAPQAVPKECLRCGYMTSQVRAGTALAAAWAPLSRHRACGGGRAGLRCLFCATRSCLQICTAAESVQGVHAAGGAEQGAAWSGYTPREIEWESGCSEWGAIFAARIWVQQCAGVTPAQPRRRCRGGRHAGSKRAAIHTSIDDL